MLLKWNGNSSKRTRKEAFKKSYKIKYMWDLNVEKENNDKNFTNERKRR